MLAAARAPAAPTVAKWGGGGHLSISKEFFGSTTEPYTGQLTPTYRYTMTNARGMKIQLLSYGATTQAIYVPAATATSRTWCWDSRPSRLCQVLQPAGGPDHRRVLRPDHRPVRNRIAKGTFQLKQPDGKLHTYTLQINNGPNSLHGGVVGFGNHIWSQVGSLIQTNNEVGVTLQLVSPNGDGGGAAGSPGCVSACTGYPAQITVDVTFTLNNRAQYGIHYNVVNDSPNLNTITNLTNHSYFNLAGEASGSAADQPIFINADNYTPTDATSIPFGTITPVAGTPFDFTHAKPIFPSISDCTQPGSQACTQLIQAEGFDHNWVLNSSGPKLHGLNLAATAFDPGSGRKMSVWTDQPGVQFYTSNFLTGTLIGISGHTYRQTQAYTFETQHFPNSPNQPNFPSTELGAGQTLTTTTIYAFSS